MQIKKVECPLCDKKYVSRVAVYAHIEREHEIPENVYPDQYYYDLTHNGKRTHCTECGQLTTWNPRTHKYHRLCGKPECREKVRQEFRQRMLRVHHTDNLADNPEHQKKMLAGRSISGVYHWSTGGETQYTGSYEKDFLQICDNMLGLKAEDILGPSPHVYTYKYEGKYHFYIPDFYIPDLNIEIEIKDGGDNPNMHQKIQKVDKIKEANKDAIMEKQTNVHYIKIVNKNYGRFIVLFQKIRGGELTHIEERDKIKIID